MYKLNVIDSYANFILFILYSLEFGIFLHATRVYAVLLCPVESGNNLLKQSCSGDSVDGVGLA